MSKGVKSFARSAAQLALLGASSLALMGQAAWAQDGGHHGSGERHASEGQERRDDRDRRDDDDRDAITVTGERVELQSPRYTAPLLDTPQTVTVVSAEVIEQQNLLGLRDILSTLPGITFGAGEGGGGYGDSINLRGYSANNDISVDGVRDSAQYTRTDPFNLEQVEVTNGANSVYSGAGSVGGSINLATKRPTSQDRTVITAAGGTDAYARVTLDMNQPLGDDAAFRLNLMGHQNDQPGRDVETYERWGIAPSFTFGLGTDTRVTALYVHQEDDNTPQYGVPFALNAFNDGPMPGVDPSDYFGYRNVDRQEITADSFTLILEHDFSDTLSIRNLTRYQEVSQLAIVDAPQGTFCLAGTPNFNPYTGAACSGSNTTPGTVVYTASGPRGNLRDTTNEIMINQTDLTVQFNTGALAHTVVTGIVFSNESYHLDTGNVLRNANSTTPVLPSMSLSNPNSYYTGPLNYFRTSFTDSEVRNRAIYAFDRIEIGDHWEANGGIRYEQNEGHATGAAITYAAGTPPVATVTPSAPADTSDNLLSYRLGLVYKPVESMSFYVAYGNSQTPSQSTVNGSCTVAGGSTGASNCNVDPEEAVNYEIGAKWDTLGGRLQLTAAIFRNERTNFRVNSGDPTVPQQQLDGASRVDGVALGASGLITDHWSVFANYTYLDSEILQNISDVAIGGGALDFQAGDPLPNTPEHSFSLWTTYEISHGFMIGYGATYQGEYTFNRVSGQQLYYTDDYWVQRAMVSYEITDGLVAQLNINNLTDELYYERIRNNSTSGWATPGAARNAVLSLSYQF